MAPFNPPPHTVAVLAFANMSNDPAQEYLSDGLAEALIDVLSRVDQLRVTARTSSFTFKGHTATIEEIGRKLNRRRRAGRGACASKARICASMRI